MVALPDLPDKSPYGRVRNQSAWTWRGRSAHIERMSNDIKLTPEHFEAMTGRGPADWPERFAPGTLAKVVTHFECFRTKITEDDGKTIKGVPDYSPFAGFAEHGGPVEYTG